MSSIITLVLKAKFYFIFKAKNRNRKLYIYELVNVFDEQIGVFALQQVRAAFERV
jgi:hypothetical protein